MTPDQSYAHAHLSDHAVAELARRGLRTAEVQQTLDHPEQVLLMRPGRVVLHRRFDGSGRPHLMRVFVDVDRDPPVLVTAYRTSKIEKYWSPK